MEITEKVPYCELFKPLIGSKIVRIEEPLEIYDTVKEKPLRDAVQTIASKKFDSDIETLTEGIVRFLKGPVIIDTFLHHNERRKYVRSLKNEKFLVYYKAYQENILRRNLIISAITVADTLVDNLTVDSSIRAIVMGSSNKEVRIGSYYDGLKNEHKITIVRAIQKAIYNGIDMQL